MEFLFVVNVYVSPGLIGRRVRMKFVSPGAGMTTGPAGADESNSACVFDVVIRYGAGVKKITRCPGLHLVDPEVVTTRRSILWLSVRFQAVKGTGTFFKDVLMAVSRGAAYDPSASVSVLPQIKAASRGAR